MRVLVALLVFLLTAGLAAAQSRLVVAGAVCVDGPVITLADLAQAQGPQAQAFLAGVGREPLLASPKFDGARTNLNGPRLADLIRKRFGPGLPPLEVPDQVQVQRGGQVVASASLRPWAKARSMRLWSLATAPRSKKPGTAISAITS